MGSYDEWCEERISKLMNEDVRLPILQELKEFLSTIPREDISRTANFLRLPVLFDCLNDSNNEQVDLTCEVLTICMSNLNLGESTNKYGTFLERALNHPFPAVKLMALNEIKRNIGNEDILVDLCKRESLMINIIQCVSDDDVGVAKKACEILTKLGLSSSGIKLLANPEILKTFHEIMSSEIVRLRVYEVFIGISVHSVDNFNIVKTSIFPQIMEELDNNDVLLRLNVLELLSQLGNSKHGYEYLQSTNVLKKLSAFLESDDTVSLQLCEPGILKFFGNIAHWRPIEVLEKYPNFVQKLFNNLDSSDFTVVGVSLDTLGHIGQVNDGKVALDATGELMENTIKTITKSLPSMTTDIKIRAFSCLENLVRVINPNPQILSIARKWYNLFDDEPTEFIFKYARNPFAEIRLGALGVLGAVAGQSWGAAVIKDTPGLMEFLLDRAVERTKECKEAKYGIVEVLSCSQVFDLPTLKRLQCFVKEGPFYVHTVMEVAVEQND